MHGATIVMHEGAPDYPSPTIWLQTVEEQKVTLFYTAPTALRMLMQLDSTTLDSFKFNHLRAIGSVGEPIGPEVWHWYYSNIGKKRCPVIDTWWQTETGGFMIAPTTSSLHTPKPGSAQFPLPGIEVMIVDEQGNEVPANTKGYLLITKPWPGMALGIHGDSTALNCLYEVNENFHTGDYALRDQDGYYWLLGRSDEVVKVAGHRIGTAEIEHALATHYAVAESAAIGITHQLKGEVIAAFIVLKKSTNANDELVLALKKQVRKAVGAFAVPAHIFFVASLPKTNSGKIMRRVLKAFDEDKTMGDLSTLENHKTIESLKK